MDDIPADSEQYLKAASLGHTEARRKMSGRNPRGHDQPGLAHKLSGGDLLEMCVGGTADPEGPDPLGQGLKTPFRLFDLAPG